ncbi:hypothetical protein AAU61_21100 [Desulfocarbo indianensis]|nr:hypothetical protein AAU61_21100 [Desulfocarbo indianensis]
MLQEIHFLLTYTCNYECDHCFLYCSPRSQGTFTLAQVGRVLAQARETGTVKGVCFEGGEPLLFFPLLVHSVKAAHEMGFRVGLVTNAYLATCPEDAQLWLRPLMEAGVDYLSMSDDSFHAEGEDNPARRALAAAQKLGVGSGAICISPPALSAPGEGVEKGAPVIGGGAMFRGRAAEKLTQGLPLKDWRELVECPHEELADPGRVHLDCFGNVHICQGISMGNLWERPLAEMVRDYRPQEHPVCGPLSRGGPAELVRQYDLPHEDAYVDECHLCFLARKTLLDSYPGHLTPRQVYGLED